MLLCVYHDPSKEATKEELPTVSSPATYTNVAGACAWAWFRPSLEKMLLKQIIDHDIQNQDDCVDNHKRLP